MQPLYIRVCRCCEVVFQSPQKKKQLCPDCAKQSIKSSKNNHTSRKAYTNEVKDTFKKPVLSISDICRIQKQYNEAHKTCLQYGDIVEKIRTGEIKLVMGKDGVELGCE